MQAFLVSLIAGVAFPLLPILAEYGVTHHVQLEAIALVAIVYAAAVGMSSSAPICHNVRPLLRNNLRHYLRGSEVDRQRACRRTISSVRCVHIGRHSVLLRCMLGSRAIW